MGKVLGMNQTIKLTEDELIGIQKMNADFNKAKMALGDLELRRHELLLGIDSLKITFSENEKMLIDKYGIDSVINIQTGEVTQKQPTS